MALTFFNAHKTLLNVTSQMLQCDVIRFHRLEAFLKSAAASVYFSASVLFHNETLSSATPQFYGHTAVELKPLSNDLLPCTTNITVPLK